MTSDQTSSPLIITLTKYVPLVEKVLLIALTIGIILVAMDMDTSMMRISLMGLAVTFFLRAYRPTDILRQEGEPFGFSELLGLMIAPKVLWISSAISAVGIAFSFSIPDNDGYRQMLLIGGLSIASGTIILGIFWLMGIKHISTVIPVLFRAIPLCLIDFYMLFMKGH